MRSKRAGRCTADIKWISGVRKMGGQEKKIKNSFSSENKYNVLQGQLYETLQGLNNHEKLATNLLTTTHIVL